MRYIISIIILVVGFFALLLWAINNPGITYINWGSVSIQGRTAAFVLYLALAFIVLHIALNLIFSAMSLRKKWRHYRDNRSLSSGLIWLTEANWVRAEKALLNNVEHSDTPVVSYIAAAKAAHMQEAYDRRDEWLKLALQYDQKAHLAVGVSQAEMQLGANQLEQAYATLKNLWKLNSKHPYVVKLLARVLYRRESWDELLDLLPDLLNLAVLKPEDMNRVELATLTGMFKKQIKEGGSIKLQALWKRLPVVVREHKEVVYLYAQMLHEANDDVASAQFIQGHLAQQWHDSLADLYGRIHHANNSAVLQEAQKWRDVQGNNPVMLLMMARLYRQQQLWGAAKHYYEVSVNQAPNAQAYLELAELLELMDEIENAQRCYQVGLRYSIYQKGERLTLLTSPIRSA